ncbi:TlpA family protein disulfide reductase [Sediminibacterium ginsengisoli]|nr:TlpA disulfide reductase family protein [Sediminibacterium ginsengisoli]
MKQLLVLTLALPLSVLAQKKSASAVEVLQKTLNKLESLKTVSYSQTRETRYFADNYQHTLKADMFIDFAASNALNLRFQAESDKTIFVYDGQYRLLIDKENQTIDSASAATFASMRNNSYLYHSLAMLRRMIPGTIANDSIRKSVSDTLIGKTTYYNVRMEGDGMYFALLGGMEYYKNAQLRRPYYLLIDKKTYLPYQFISKYIRGTDDRDYVTMTYSNMDTRANTPAPRGWSYAAYADTYKPYVAPAVIPLIKPGTQAPGFTLPAYLPAGIDSLSLQQYAGKVVLLEFWFKSCGPCMEAMPHYNELQQSFNKSDFALITINVEDPVEDIKFFYNKYQPVYPMLYNGRSFWQSVGFTGAPASLLIDRAGKVREVIRGFVKDDIEKKVKGLVGE